MNSVDLLTHCITVPIEKKSLTVKTCLLLYLSTFPLDLSHLFPGFSHLPEKVAAEDEAEHEDKQADAQHNDIHIEREVIDVRRHAAEVFRALRTQTTQAS